MSLADIRIAIPGCTDYALCRYSYTSESRIGVAYLTATTIFHDWQIAFNMRQPNVKLIDLPIMVKFVQRQETR